MSNPIFKVKITFPSKKVDESQSAYEKRIDEFEKKTHARYIGRLPNGAVLLVEHQDFLKHPKIEVVSGGGIDDLVKELKTFRSKLEL